MHIFFKFKWLWRYTFIHNTRLKVSCIKFQISIYGKLAKDKLKLKIDFKYSKSVNLQSLWDFNEIWNNKGKQNVGEFFYMI